MSQFIVYECDKCGMQVAHDIPEGWRSASVYMGVDESAGLESRWTWCKSCWGMISHKPTLQVVMKDIKPVG